ncbi:MAG: FHA domain-containing protein [Polyangiaceae bacterium]|nr:FHA domain-containing protein [Polyangiaceae bacterium]
MGGPPSPMGGPPPLGGPGGFPPPGAPMPPTNAMSGFDAQPRPTGTTGQGSAKSRRPLAGFLVSFQDDALGKFWPLYQGRNLVGRAETGQEVDVPIGHGTTSTNHATIDAENGRLTLSDLGSTNGTFHNEEAIGFQGRRELRDGDKIRFGGFSVIVINVAARA